MLINDILDDLKLKYPHITKAELERIVDSQFLCSKMYIEDKTVKTIKWYNLGKIKPSTFLINNYERFSKKS